MNNLASSKFCWIFINSRYYIFQEQIAFHSNVVLFNKFWVEYWKQKHISDKWCRNAIIISRCHRLIGSFHCLWVWICYCEISIGIGLQGRLMCSCWIPFDITYELIRTYEQFSYACSTNELCTVAEWACILCFDLVGGWVAGWLGACIKCAALHVRKYE